MKSLMEKLVRLFPIDLVCVKGHTGRGGGDGETRGRGDSDPGFRIQLLQAKCTVRNSQRAIFIETAQDPITAVTKGGLPPAQE